MGDFQFFNFFYFPVITLRRFGPCPKMKNLTLSHSVTHLTHLQAQTLISLTRHASSSDSHLTHAVKLASLSLASAASVKCSLCTRAPSAQRLRRSLHSCSSALLCTAACSALCTGNVLISKLLSFFYFDFLFHFLGSVFFFLFFFHFSRLHQVLN